MRDLIRRLVRPISGFLPASLSSPPVDVVIHNPAADGPQNLDDPFVDAEAQRRVGEFIARNAAKRGPTETG